MTADEQCVTPLDPALPRVLFHVRGKMIEEEVLFWERLRSSFRDLGFELFVIAHNTPARPADVPVLRVPNGCDRVPTIDGCGWRHWLDTSEPTAGDADRELLDREALWWGAASEEGAVRRAASVRFFRAFYAAALQMSRPRVVVIWNGTHAQEMILAGQARSAGAALAYIERAPIRGFVHLDENGILGASRAAEMSEWEWDSEKQKAHGRALMERVCEAYRCSGETWWHQPESVGAKKLRKRLGIKPGQRVVLFAGQVESDAQSFFFSPHFASNVDAFGWLAEQLASHEDVFLLGKHHPMSFTGMDEYRARIRGCGAWVDDLSLEDALALADRVAAVNSSVLCEALTFGMPVLSLGESILSNKGVAYEASPGGQGEALREWLQARDLDARIERWLDLGGWLLDNCFFSMQESPPEGALSHRALAEAVVSMAPPNNIEPPDAPWFPLEDATCLFDARTELASHGAPKRMGRSFRRGGRER